MAQKETTKKKSGKALALVAGQILGIGLIAGAALILCTEKGMKRIAEKLSPQEKPDDEA